jgi:hypothetical protein
MNDTYEIREAERKKPKPIDANALGLKPVMKNKDWAMLIVLIVIAGSLWTWVWHEYKKPIVAEKPPIDISEEEAS